MTKSFGLLGFGFPGFRVAGLPGLPCEGCRVVQGVVRLSRLSRLQLYNVQLVHCRPDIHTTHNCKVDVEEREDAVKYTQDYLGIIIEVIR